MLFIFNLQREQKSMLIFLVLFIHTLIDVSVHFLVNAKHNIVTYVSQRVYGMCRYCLAICLSYPFFVIYLGCPQNKQFFFQFEPKLNLFRLFFGLFHETKKTFFSVCFNVSDRYRNNRNKQNFLETN
jgi:hypothetical protein